MDAENDKTICLTKNLTEEIQGTGTDLSNSGKEWSLYDSKKKKSTAF